MLKTNKKTIGGLLFIWVMAIGIGYFTTCGDETTAGMFFMTATSVFISLVILMIIVIDKKERSEKRRELRMYRLIHAEIDGVVEIQKQGDRTYKVYTDTDIYMAEYGKTASKIIHVGDYQRVDMEG